MADEKDYSVDGKDRAEWDRAWRAMPHRRVATLAELGGGGNLIGRFGQPESATLSLDPPRFVERVWRESECCPVCGGSTAAADRLPASLHPQWANGLSVGIGVWVHRTCFESCAVADEPTPIPW
jgi:hypothetical protein